MATRCKSCGLGGVAQSNKHQEGSATVIEYTCSFCSATYRKRFHTAPQPPTSYIWKETPDKPDTKTVVVMWVFVASMKASA